MDLLGTSWGNIAYRRTEGRTPTLVFLHGTGCDADDWSGVLEALPSDIATLTLDFRGHGDSSVPDEDFQFTDLAADVNLALEILGVERPLIVGHSLGGMVGIELGKRKPLAGLVLLEGWTRLGVARKAFEDRQRLGKLTDEQIAEIDRKREATLARFGGDQWRGFWHTVREFDGEDTLSILDFPIWQVYGSHRANDDTLGHLAIPERPNIRVEWIEGCGHYLPHEAPDRVADICKRAHTEVS